MSSSVVIEAKNISKVYPQGREEVRALSHIDLCIETGTAVAVVGKSGSGKSTLLHLLSGLDTPTEGEVVIDGTRITGLDEHRLCLFRREQIGFVFQFFHLIPELNIRENILFPILLAKEKPDEDYISGLIHELELDDRIYHLPKQLSGGEQQRVAIARALAGKPGIVMCDEPTGNLDETTGMIVIQKLLAAREKYGQTMVIVTHDRDIAAMADRIIRLSHGEIEGDSEHEK